MMRATHARRIACLLVAATLAGCDGAEHRELQAELADISKDMRGRVDPLPPVHPYTPYAYGSFEIPDPFSPGKIKVDPRNETVSGANTELATFHQNRPKEPLEAYSLESLKMVGTLARGAETQGLVKASSGLFRVKVGNYLGQNFGVVTKVSASEIVLKELIQDGAGDWAERVSTLLLQEAEANPK